jgi:hypothetical protein
MPGRKGAVLTGMAATAGVAALAVGAGLSASTLGALFDFASAAILKKRNKLFLS